MVKWVAVVKVAILLSLPNMVLFLYYSLVATNSGQREGDTFTTNVHFHSHPSPPLPHRQKELPLLVVAPPPGPAEGPGEIELKNERKILVTGSAGFIGYHISRALVERWGATVVVGLDNFNDYYDVQLKRDRANELIKLGVRQYRGDVCDVTLLSHLFSEYEFTDVIHLAAQAGVRHSLEQPLSFIQANVQCFLTLLDTLTHQKSGARLVFASSSSVYGEEAILPFSVSSHPHSVTNIYAASKVANEQFAEAYCSQHGLRTIGLRFFTVYGPWGRPDMAVYKFAEQIAKGLPVPMFDSSQPLMRDFTFVNDTVGGVLAALDHTPSRCGEIYNVGTGRPLNLNVMLKYLEEEMNISAKIDLLPLPPSDLRSTYADISETRKVLEFHPKVSLREGIREFVKWFRWYSERREEMKEEGYDQFDQAIVHGEREVAAAYGKKVEGTNKVYRERMEALRERYSDFAQVIGREVQNVKKNGFVYYPGVDSPGGTVIKAPGYRDNIKALKDRCYQTEQCIGFNTNAELKNRLLPQHLWTRTAEGEGLYVADINMCESDLHDCGRHTDCVHLGPASYSCSCQPGFIRLGRQCVEKYAENQVSRAEWAWQLSDQLDGLSWDKMSEGRPFVFIQGLDSPGGDYLVVEGGAGNAERMKEVCQHTHHCLAFNTNGILKHSLLPPSKWVSWTNNPHHGLYVRDMNYCTLDLEECPAHSHCVQNAPGNYSCICNSPFMMEKGDSGALRCAKKLLEDTDLIHVIVSVDRTHFPGLVGVVNSALSHASRPERFKFHIVLSGAEESVLASFLRCYGFNNHPQLEVTRLNSDWLKGKVKVYTDVSRVGNLASLANFGRFLFHEHFPMLNRAIYLDADTAVLGDLGEFWDKLLATDKIVLAAPRRSPTYGSMFRGRVKDKFQERYGFTFEDSDPTFNAGVYGINFDLWRSRNVHDEVQYWLDEQAKEPLWEFGTQPIMLLVLYHQWEELEPEWNVDGLGWKKVVNKDVLRSAKLLHWNGKGKPWLEDGLHQDLWLPHLPLECSGQGSCINQLQLDNGGLDNGHYVCQCRDSHTGTNCATTVDPQN